MRIFDFGMSFVEKEIGIRESKQNYYVDYGEREHVTGNHRVNHSHEGSSESNGSENF